MELNQCDTTSNLLENKQVRHEGEDAQQLRRHGPVNKRKRKQFCKVWQLKETLRNRNHQITLHKSTIEMLEEKNFEN